MTKKIFWENPYQTSLDTIVATVNGPDVTVRSTIFFALAGGQESDRGFIGGYPVLEARKDGLEIIYTLPDDHGLAPGETIRIEIDWPRRYRLMRLHFAAELVLELFYRRLPGIDKVGAHIGEAKARVDFTWPENITAMLHELAAEANRIIDDDLEIKSGFADETTERRYWEIKDFARVSCGGTHLHRTGEIGRIQLKRNNIGRGKERVEIFLQP